MKNLFKNPFFYINIFLLVLLILLSASINPNSTNLPSFAKKAIAAVANILGEGTVNYLAAFTGANQIGNSIIYDTGTKVGIGVTNPSQKLDVGSNNISANDYWIQAANSGTGKWASQMGGGGTYQTFSATGVSVNCPSGWGMTGGGCWCVDASRRDDSSAYGGRPSGNGWQCMKTTGAGCSGGLTTYVRCVQQ